MESELKLGLIIQSIKDNIVLEENMDQVNTFGMMDQNLKEIGLKIK